MKMPGTMALTLRNAWLWRKRYRYRPRSRHRRARPPQSPLKILALLADHAGDVDPRGLAPESHGAVDRGVHLRSRAAQKIVAKAGGHLPTIRASAS